MKKSRLFRGLAVTTAVAALASALYAPPPAWWAQQGVLNSGATANDYAAVNLGQLKQIAMLARDALELKVDGGAGDEISGVVNSWLASNPPSGVVRNDYAAVNIGQLKNLATLYYNRLAAFHYHGPPLLSGQTYPWTTTTSDDNDYAAANIGQVKYLFSFDLSAFTPDDKDGDGLPDDWERQYFGNLAKFPEDDPDGDGVSNLLEYQLGRNPTKGTVADTAGAVDLRVYSPTR